MLSQHHYFPSTFNPIKNYASYVYGVYYVEDKKDKWMYERVATSRICPV